jgi:hypothetical protein
MAFGVAAEPPGSRPAALKNPNSRDPATRSRRPGHAHDPCPRSFGKPEGSGAPAGATHFLRASWKAQRVRNASHARLPALRLRRFSAVGPRLGFWADRAQNLFSDAPRARVVLPGGRSPEAPGSPADEAGPAGAAFAGRISREFRRPTCPARRRRAKQPACPIARRHRSTPLDEQDSFSMRPDSWAGISFCGGGGTRPQAVARVERQRNPGSFSADEIPGFRCRSTRATVAKFRVVSSNGFYHANPINPR